MEDLGKEVKRLLNGFWKEMPDIGEMREIPERAGVYVIAYTDEDIACKKVKDFTVIYVGMSNSFKGLRNRLRQFRHSVNGNFKHSAGNRFYKEWLNGQAYLSVPDKNKKKRKKLYFSYVDFERNPDENGWTARDLKLMGMVSALEYYTLSHLLETRNGWPELNAKKGSFEAAVGLPR